MVKKLLTPKYLQEILSYDPGTGLFVWRARKPSQFTNNKRQTAEHNCAIWNGNYAGKPAMCYLRSNGYLVGNLGGRIYRAHRVAWAITYNRWPIGDIDHINRNRQDNRIANLREATRSENLRNKRLQDNNKSGIIGVSWAQERDQWNVKIGHNGKSINCGYFNKLSDAANARAAAELRFWGTSHPCNRRAILAAQGMKITEV